jgi:tetrapyrrole methylase family protein/MazG family protein
MDPQVVVVVRTLKHPAAAELAQSRSVESCDDLYDSQSDFDAVYEGIVERVVAFASGSDVVYAVPGSALVGERAVAGLRTAGTDSGINVRILPSLSFLDLVYEAVDLDPIADGLQVVDARDLPDPLPLHLPTVVTQVDSPLRSADVSVALGRILDPGHPLVILDRLGDADQVIEQSTVEHLAIYPAGERTSVFVQRSRVGILGLIETNRILRMECPWDREQTHHSLVTHLIEEAYETVDAIGHLPVDAPGGETDFGAYAEVEEELGDVLLQVVFHATLASETGAFDIDEVAEGIRRKLVARHPHVFGDVVVSGPDEVLANWEKLKQDEKERESLMDDIPESMPGIPRAMKVQKRASSVGFDWDEPKDVFRVLESEIAELAATSDAQQRTHELGDVLFSAINLARHLDVDPEVALRLSVERFSARFKAVERELSAQGLDVSEATDAQLDVAWTRAKEHESDDRDAKQ